MWRSYYSEAVEILRNASRHVTYLINEGYNLKRSVIFAGDHYLLSKRQRLAVMRSVATEEQLKERNICHIETWQGLKCGKVWCYKCLNDHKTGIYENETITDFYNLCSHSERMLYTG